MIVSASTLAGQQGKVADTRASKANEGPLAATTRRQHELPMDMTIPPDGV